MLHQIKSQQFYINKISNNNFSIFLKTSIWVEEIFQAILTKFFLCRHVTGWFKMPPTQKQHGRS